MYVKWCTVCVQYLLYLSMVCSVTCVFCMFEGSSTVTMATSHDRSHDSSDGEYVTDVYYTENCPEMDTDTL